eukprot:TRINITY_DN2465_c0_g1_i2.p1 TRINITY_DN2465_c0_g1~~TRINITY_DN2465_c0_g1_i2.p1  ORF type:complete len:174 (+),score=18.56 TRINITY_DN2465_c0_g1_i2:297-818(+)
MERLPNEIFTLICRQLSNKDTYALCYTSSYLYGQVSMYCDELVIERYNLYDLFLINVLSHLTVLRIYKNNNLRSSFSRSDWVHFDCLSFWDHVYHRDHFYFSPTLKTLHLCGEPLMHSVIPRFSELSEVILQNKISSGTLELLMEVKGLRRISLRHVSFENEIWSCLAPTSRT